MEKFKFTETHIKGVFVIDPTTFEDNRGYFMETYNKEDFKRNGLDINFVQDNQSKSSMGVLRGLHYQYKYPQGKLVRVTMGETFDVTVDLREGSQTYGQWFGIILSGENQKQIYIPEGLAHGFLVLSEEAVFQYKCTDFYHPEYQGGIPWNDPDISINWPLTNISNLIISDKDQNWKPLNENRVIL